MTHEYQPVTRERPEHLETKSTIDTVIVPSPAQVPHSSRTGAAVTDDERHDADIVPGTLAAGNGVQNSSERRGGGRSERRGSGDGVSRGSGGKQTRTGRGTTGATPTGSTGGAGTAGSSTSATGKASTGTGPATDPGGQAEKSD